MEVGFVSLEDAVESELGDGQDLALDVHDRGDPGLALLVPQSHVECLADHVFDDFFVVAVGESDEHQHSLLDVGNSGPLNLDPALEDSLNDYPHE